MATKYRAIVRAVHREVWAILPEKLATIRDIIQERAAGRKPSKREIAERLGPARQRTPAQSSGSVAVLNIFGTIAQHAGSMQDASGGISSDAIGAAFDKAMADPNVGTIVLNIDSPGGTVAGTPELAAKIYAARGQKKIIAVANSLAASAAYWLGSAASRFIASPSSQVGSIGVLSIHTDDSKAMEKMGVKETVVSAGKYKAEGYGPLTDDAKAAMQDRVDCYYSMFIDAVAKHRGVSASVAVAKFGQGRTMLAQDALAAGMVDAVMSLDQVFQELGVRAAADSQRTDAPAFSLEGLSMNPELYCALVRAGMCQYPSTQAEAENALDRFYEVSGKAKPADAAAQLLDVKALIANPQKPSVAQPIPKPPVPPNAEDRSNQIMALVKLANFGADAFDFANELIADKTLDVAAAQKKIEEKAAKLRKPVGPVIENSVAEQQKFANEARSALLVRAMGGNIPKEIYDARSRGYVEFKPTRASGALQSLPRLAEECLIRGGYDATAIRSLNKDEIVQLAMGLANPDRFGIRAEGGGPFNTTGSFTNLLLDAANVTLRRSYDDGRTTYQQWMRRAPDISDFKNVNRVIGGELGDPRAVPEGAEFEETTMTDGKVSYALTVWGEIFSISYQAVVNDQLSAFTEIPTKQGRAMKRKQNRLGYGVLKDNAAMADGGLLFNTTAITSSGGHNNLTTGAGAPGVSTLNTLSKMMMEQKGLDTTNGAVLNIMPRFIISCPALRGTILELLGSTSYVQANSNSGVKNIWQNALDPVIDAELGAAASGSDTAWYLAADPNEVDTVEYAFLQGGDAPTLDSMPSFRRLAIDYRIHQAFAVKAIDYRGLQKHAGA